MWGTARGSVMCGLCMNSKRLEVLVMLSVCLDSVAVCREVCSAGLCNDVQCVCVCVCV